MTNDKMGECPVLDYYYFTISITVLLLVSQFHLKQDTASV